MGNIARIFKVSTGAVLKWIRAAGTPLEPVKADKKADIVMIDEVWHFVNGKKTLYGCGELLMGYRADLSDGHWAIVLMSALKKSCEMLIQENLTL